MRSRVLILIVAGYGDAAMSNHWGSYMLNEALEALEDLSVLEQVGKEKSLQIVAKFLHISDENDGNRGEVLMNIGDC